MRSSHPQIWQVVHDLGLGFVFNNLGDANINLIGELYARWDLGDEEQSVPICGRFINISANALSNHLKAPDVPHAPLANFITQPSYGDIRHTLWCQLKCYLNSGKRTHNRITLPKQKFNKVSKI